MSNAAEKNQPPSLSTGESTIVIPSITWPLAGLAALLLFNALFIPKFFHFETRGGHLYGSLIDVFHRGAPVMLLAVGMTLVIATGGVDLSVGALMAISGAVAAGLLARPAETIFSSVKTALPFPVVFASGLLTGLLAGLWNGALVALLEIQPIVATLILMVAGRGIAQLLTNGQIVAFSNPGFEFLGSGFFLGVPFTLAVALTTVAVTILATRSTALGLFIEAVGNNPIASRCAGVNTKLVKLMVYAFCGFCAGLAGLLAAADIRAADANNAGLYLELDAILAVVIGGTALAGGRYSLIGSTVGAVLIQTLTTTILTLGIRPTLTLVVKAVVVIAVCLLQAPKFRRLFKK